MQSFISETIDDILKTTTSFEEVIFILPSQRAKVFVKDELRSKIKVGFLPEMLNIEQFIQRISGIQKVDSIQLLFYFYNIYKNVEKNPDSFDVFSSWALTVIQDFSEVDQYLIDTNDIFIYLRDIERLRKWSVKGTFKETALIRDHNIFLEKLNSYYNAFYQFLLEKKIGYQGLLYKEATKNIDAYLLETTDKKFFFIGFNALNKAEEILFQKVLERGNAEAYWDIDTTFFNSSHQAGKFIRKYKNEWKYYEKKPLKSLGNTFLKPKNIQVIGAPKNTTQIKHIGEILQHKDSVTNTALVLADETLLPITLNSLPKNISNINITMGYPLKDVPTTGLLLVIFQMFLSQKKLQKNIVNEFYYKDVIQFFKHPLIYGILENVDDFTAQIAKENQTFVKEDDIKKLLNKSNTATQKVIENIFKPFDTIACFIDAILALILLLKDKANTIEKEYLFRFYTTFTQLKTLQNQFVYFTDLKTLAQFFKQLIASENLSFQGEPLKGLQLMGMLETRVLDFENIILASANEGILPANSQQNSFIPFDVKVQFGLPTYREKDAIFSYHFFRLLQRAKNVYILYNTENDVFGSGERSRFVTQLEMLRSDVVQKIITPQVLSQKIELKQIEKNDLVMKQLQELAKKGFSPSSLTNYLHNPIAFYKQKILRIQEFDDVEETIAYNTLGTVVHETLDELYSPFIGLFLKVDDILKMEKESKKLIEKHFKIQFKNGDMKTGKNRLIFEVAHRFVVNFLVQEKDLLKDKNNQLKILATEENLATEIEIEELNFPVKLHGNVDRVDELNGELRIIDYKSGMVKSTELKVLDLEQLRAKEQYKAIQVLLYAYLFTKNKKFDYSKNLKAGIFSFKNLKSGFLPINFSSNYRKPDTDITPEKLDEFIAMLKTYLVEIYNPDIAFLEPADLKY